MKDTYYGLHATNSAVAHNTFKAACVAAVDYLQHNHNATSTSIHRFEPRGITKGYARVFIKSNQLVAVINGKKRAYPLRYLPSGRAILI